MLVGYWLTAQTDEYTYDTDFYCVACGEDVRLVWKHLPQREIDSKEAEEQALQCCICNRLLVVVTLEHQIEERDNFLHDIWQFLEYGGIEMGTSSEYRMIKAYAEKAQQFAQGASLQYILNRRRRRRW